MNKLAAPLLLLVLFLNLISMGWANVLFCAVGWNGEFTHISPGRGQIEPTRILPVTCLQAMAWSPDGKLYVSLSSAYSNYSTITQIDPVTGQMGTDSITISDADIRGMAFNSKGELYVSNTRYLSQWESELGKIDLEFGTYTKINKFSSSGAGGWPQGLAFSPDGQLFGISPATGGGHSLITIDTDTAEKKLIGTYSYLTHIAQSIEFTPDGSLYALGIENFAQIDPANGSIIGQMYGLDGDFRGLAIVPEPCTVLLLGLGVAIIRQRIS